jgi:hypothetical protein
MSMPFFVDIIAADMRADFAARGIAAEVLVGEWKTYLNKNGPRVILGMGAGLGQSIGDKAFRFGAGADFDTGDGTVARPLWSCLQNVNVWVTSPCTDMTIAPDDRAEAARANTWNLTTSALGAMWRSHGGEFPWGNLEYLNEAQGARTYGAAVKLVAQYPIPVLDDPNDLVSVAETRGRSTLDLQDAPLDVPETDFTDDGTDP